MSQDTGLRKLPPIGSDQEHQHLVEFLFEDGDPAIGSLQPLIANPGALNPKNVPKIISSFLTACKNASLNDIRAGAQRLIDLGGTDDVLIALWDRLDIQPRCRRWLSAGLKQVEKKGRNELRAFAQTLTDMYARRGAEVCVQILHCQIRELPELGIDAGRLKAACVRYSIDPEDHNAWLDILTASELLRLRPRDPCSSTSEVIPPQPECVGIAIHEKLLNAARALRVDFTNSDLRRVSGFESEDATSRWLKALVDCGFLTRKGRSPRFQYSLTLR